MVKVHGQPSPNGRCYIIQGFSLAKFMVTVPSTLTLVYTPQKTNIEPENHTFEQENHLPNLHF